MQRTAGSNSGIEKDFKGGVDQDSKEELVRNPEWKNATMWYLYNLLNWNVKKKLESKIRKIEGKHNLTLYQLVINYLSFCEIDDISCLWRRFEHLQNVI